MEEKITTARMHFCFRSFSKSDCLRWQAFTLVEMLVVIAIMSILSALLMPALHKSIEQTRQVSCAQNLKQLGMGVAMYINDYNGWLPRSSYNADYVYYIDEYLEFNYQNGQKSDANRLIQFGEPSGSAFCPSLSSPPQSSPCWNDSGNAQYYFPSYCTTMTFSQNLNSGCWVNRDSSNAIVWQRRYLNIKSGSVLLLDKNWYTVSGDTYQCSVSNYPNYAHYPNDNPTFGGHAPGWNHLLSANMLFKDFHVESFQYTGIPWMFDNDFIPVK